MQSRNTDHAVYLENLSERHKPFQEIISRFGAILLSQLELRSQLPQLQWDKTGIDEQEFIDGRHLLSFFPPEQFSSLFVQAAETVWLAWKTQFQPLTAEIENCQKCLSKPEWVKNLLHFAVLGEESCLQEAAEEADVNASLLVSLLFSAYGPCVGAQHGILESLISLDLWHHGHCPICASFPDAGCLEQRINPSEFLVSKSGQLWLHCACCGLRWRFPRVTCLHCGNQNPERLERMSSTENPREMFYVCKECQHYFLCADTVEQTEVNKEFAGLSMIYLDAVAQSRGYTPISSAPWAGFME